MTKRAWVHLWLLAACLFAVLAPRTARADVSVSGAINTDTTWQASLGPYIMTGDVVVQAGATLTIEAGTEVHAAAAGGNDVELIVSGSLVAAGTAGNEIVFRSDTLTTPGAWEGLGFADNSTAALQHAQILHADYALEFQSPTAANYAVSDVEIALFQTRGVWTDGGTLDLAGLTIDGTGSTCGRGICSANTYLGVTGSWIRNCHYGVEAIGDDVTIATTTFSGNSADGINFYANTTSGCTLSVDHCTFYGNGDAIDVRRYSSSSYPGYLSVTNSVFGENAAVAVCTSTTVPRATRRRWTTSPPGVGGAIAAGAAGVPPATGGAAPSTGGSTVGLGGMPGVGGGAVAQAGSAGEPSLDASGSSDEGGCGCRTSPSRGRGLLALPVLLGVLLLRRRRRS